jgi:AcrR family transcriptional regulator
MSNPMIQPRPTTAPAQAVDGRTARRDRNREAVIEALMEYLDEGNAQPTAQMLAVRSGVSLRSVFRYFDDLEELLLEAAPRYVARTDHHTFVAPPPGTPFGERVELWARHRARLNGRFARVFMACQARARGRGKLQDMLDGFRTIAIDNVATMFAPELAALDGDTRQVTVAALHTATSAESWVNLADRHGLGEEAVVEAFGRLVRGAFGIP